MKPTREVAIAALRAVLDMCETFDPPSKSKDPTGEILTGMERLADDIRQAIEKELNRD